MDTKTNGGQGRLCDFDDAVKYLYKTVIPNLRARRPFPNIWEDVGNETYIEMDATYKEKGWWSPRMVFNRAKSHYDRLTTDEQRLYRLDGDSEQKATQVPDNDPLPENEFAKHVLIQTCRKLLTNETDRLIFQMRFVEEANVADIVQELGSTRKAVDMRISRIRQRLMPLKENLAC